MSEETKFTPGPWKWWTSCSFRRLSSERTGRDGDVLHAVVQGSDGHPDIRLPNGGADGPDAALIAAAPELYEAADRAQCGCTVQERESGHIVGCWMPDLIAALKKARGEA